MFNGDGESFKNYYEQLSCGRYTATNTVSDWVKVPGNAVDLRRQRRRGQRRLVGLHRRLGRRLVRLDGGHHDHRPDRHVPGAVRRVGPLRLRRRRRLQRGRRLHRPLPGRARRRGRGGRRRRRTPSGRTAGTSARATARPARRSAAQNNLGGGAKIGDSKYFIGDYTVEPENGGLGVFAHEFGHDLGLPDYYDTAGGENGSAFWTLMSSGSWLSHGARTGGGEASAPSRA